MGHCKAAVGDAMKDNGGWTLPGEMQPRFSSCVHSGVQFWTMVCNQLPNERYKWKESFDQGVGPKFEATDVIF